MADAIKIPDKSFFVPQIIVPYDAFTLWIKQVAKEGRLDGLVGFMPVYDDLDVAKKFGVPVGKLVAGLTSSSKIDIPPGAGRIIH